MPSQEEVMWLAVIGFALIGLGLLISTDTPRVPKSATLVGGVLFGLACGWLLCLLANTPTPPTGRLQ